MYTTTMNLTRRHIEIVTVTALFVYSVILSHKLIASERRVGYLEGRWSVYEEMAELSPEKLPKW